MEKVLLSPNDFEVEECLVQFYQRDVLADSNGNYGWWWHCITCDEASAKFRDRDRRRKKLREHGHRTESDAMCGATMHAQAKKIHRQGIAWRKWWTKALMTTKDINFFIALWDQQYGYKAHERWRKDLTHQQIMEHIQTPNHIHMEMTSG